MTTDEIIGWLQIVQLIATMFLFPAIYFFRKAYRMFMSMDRGIKSLKGDVAELRFDLKKSFREKKKKTPSHLNRVK